MTVIMLFFGLINWEIHRPGRLVAYLFACHISLCAGYILYTKWAAKKKLKYSLSISQKIGDIFVKYFWIMFGLSVFAVIITINLSIPMYTPLQFFDAARSGFFSPGEQYQQHLANFWQDQNRSRAIILLGLSSLVAPFAFSFIPISILLRERLTLSKNIALYVAIIFNVMGAIVTGTNVANFVIAFFVVVAVFCKCLIQFREHRLSGVRKNLDICVFAILLSIFALLFFHFSIGDRLYRQGFRGTREEAFIMHIPSAESLGLRPTLINNSRITLEFYLLHAYLVLDAAFDEPFVFTRGMGHSAALSTAIGVVFGVENHHHNTYSRRVDSARTVAVGGFLPAYSDIASDVTFPGSIIVFFFIGLGLAAVWVRTTLTENPLSFALVVILSLFFITLQTRGEFLGHPPNYFAFLGLVIANIFISVIQRPIKDTQA